MKNIPFHSLHENCHLMDSLEIKILTLEDFSRNCHESINKENTIKGAINILL